LNIKSLDVGEPKLTEEKKVRPSINPVKNVLSRKGFELKERIEAMSTYYAINIQKKISLLEEQYDIIQS